MENIPFGTGFKTFSRRKAYQEKGVHFYSVVHDSHFVEIVAKKLVAPQETLNNNYLKNNIFFTNNPLLYHI